ncbi:MAG: NFACT RNA binding domain-containing protein [Campylobacterota bacterium]
MKLQILKAIAQKLHKHKFIKKVRRIDDNIIECDFKEETIYFYMLKQHGFIFKNDRMQVSKFYKAPFDTMLQKYFTKTKVLFIKTDPNDRVLLIKVESTNRYKKEFYTLRFEFTGRNTNAIIVDEEGVIVEALRHVDGYSSFRIVQPGKKLQAIPPKQLHEKEIEIGDIDNYLYEIYSDFERKQLQQLKKQKIKLVDKKLKKLQQKYEQLDDEQELEAKANRYEIDANIVLANLHSIKPYDTKLVTKDFEGNDVEIALPKDIKINRVSDYLFKKARRLRQKFENLHIEKDSLKDKIAFYERLKRTIEESDSCNEIEMLVPKRGRSKARREKSEFETFWIEDFKIYVGRNSNENQKLLKEAKANDIWMHVKDMPSAHCIIKTDKQQVPQSVIEQAAKLCVDFSVTYAGDYLVDYTQRKNVTPKEGSNVLYVKYSTISVRK